VRLGINKKSQDAAKGWHKSGEVYRLNSECHSSLSGQQYKTGA
jgi:hypothetical protein